MRQVSIISPRAALKRCRNRCLLYPHAVSLVAPRALEQALLQPHFNPAAHSTKEMRDTCLLHRHAISLRARAGGDACRALSGDTHAIKEMIQPLSTPPACHLFTSARGGVPQPKRWHACSIRQRLHHLFGAVYSCLPSLWCCRHKDGDACRAPAGPGRDAGLCVCVCLRHSTPQGWGSGCSGSENGSENGSETPRGAPLRDGPDCTGVWQGRAARQGRGGDSGHFARRRPISEVIRAIFTVYIYGGGLREAAAAPGPARARRG